MIEVHDLRHVEPDVAEVWLSKITDNLRQCDLDEIEAMASVAPKDALRTSVALSGHAYIVLGRDKEPVAIFGAAPHPLPGVGVVWMLGTDGIITEASGIARRTKRYFEELNAAYPLALWNFIDARNSVSLRWLRWGGFEMIGETTMGPNALPFHIFARTNYV